MSQKIEVNTKALTKKANRMQESLDIVTGKINTLYSDILYKIGDDWKDKSNYDYINNLSNYLSDLKDLHDSIGNYIAFLKTAAKEYENTRNENLRVATSFSREE